MKTVLITLSLILSSLLVQAQTQESEFNQPNAEKGTTISVRVPVNSNQGTIIMGLFTEDTFMKSEPLQGADSEIVDGYAEASFTNVKPGVYAITLFHDKNGNKRMDFETNGMPMEMYGLSNNPMSYGPPRWVDAKFQVHEEPITMEIRL